MCESLGLPTASLVGDQFMSLAKASSIGLGMPNLALARVQGHPGVQSKEELRRNVMEHTLHGVINNLLEQPEKAVETSEPGRHDIIIRGTLDEIDEHFIRHGLSDGLPIRPPTVQRVQAFLRYTDRDPDEVLGVLLPDSRAATTYSRASSASAVARARRAKCGISTMATATTTLMSPGPRTATTTSARSSPGIAISRSRMRINAMSTMPPADAASSPTATPATIAIATTMPPIASE